MTHNRRFFKSANVDEQVDQLSRAAQNIARTGSTQSKKNEQMETHRVRETQASYLAEAQPDAPVRLVKELQTYYQTEQQQDLASLEQAWQRIAAHPSANHTQAQNTPLPLNILRSPQERTRMMQSQHTSDYPKKKKMLRSLSLVAAALVAALLVGSMITIFTLAHQSKTGQPRNIQAAAQTPTQPALVPVASSPGLYLITQADTNQNSQVTKVDKNTGKVLWNYFLGNNGSPVVVADNIVFGTSGSDGSPTNDHGYVYALSAETGALLWQVDLGASYLVTSSPTAIMGTPLPASGVDLGALGTPVFANGIIYVSSSGGKVYALNGANGARLWTTDVHAMDYDQANQTGSFLTNMAVANGVIYGTALNKLYAIDAKTGKEIWSTSGKADYGFGSPTVDNGTIYLSDAPPSTHTGSSELTHTHIEAYSTSNGKLLWQSADFYWAGFLDNAPVVAHGLVYVANLYTGIYALDSQSGQTKWQHVLGTSAFSNLNGCSWPVVSNNVVYSDCSNDTGRTAHLIAYDATTGTTLWSQNSIANPDGVANGVLYGTSYPGLVFSYRVANGTLIAQHTYGVLLKDKTGAMWAPEPALTLVS